MSEPQGHEDASAFPWREAFRDRLMTASDALASLKRGSRIFIGSGSGEPTVLIDELTRVARHLTDLEIFHLLPLRRRGLRAPGLQPKVRMNVFSVQPGHREDVKALRADYTPAFASEIPKLFASRRIPLDAALVKVSPPNVHGYCSFGVSVDVTKTAAEAATHVIAEVNPQMPRTHGDTLIHISQLDALVESNEPLIELEYEKVDDVAAEIARLVAKLIEDGSTLSINPGSITAALCKSLKDHRDLGIHTELINDCVMPLIELGVINNRRKSINRGRAVCAACVGSQEVYQYVHDNPIFYFRPTEYVCDPAVVAQNTKMVTVAPARMVDLYGQAAITTLHPYLRAGMTGPTDFLRGAARSEGGKSILVMPSTNAQGHSRIVTLLDPRYGTLAPASDVHYVITEHGIAHLQGRSLRERAVAMIQLAAPQHRPALYAAAKAEGLIHSDQLEMPEKGDPYPEKWETTVEFEDGVRVYFRPAKPTDERRVQDFFHKHSRQTVYYRFHGHLEVLPRKDLQEFVNIDYRESMTIVGFHRDVFHGKRIVALGQYFLHRASNTAEVAFIVNDDWQNRGIGTWLLVYLAKIAREQGIQGFFAEVLMQNQRMLRVFHKSGFPMTSETEDDVIHVRLDFADQGRDIDAQVEMAPASARDKEESIDVEPRKEQTDG